MFAFALPAPALAQTLQPADLVGTWVIPGDGKAWADSLQGKVLVDVLTLNADGSYLREMKRQEGDSLVAAWKTAAGEEAVGPSRWTLVGDTFQLRQDERFQPASYKVGLKEGRLALWNWDMWDEDRRDEKCAEFVYERFDASTPLTVPPPPQITINPADLVGTWGGAVQTRQWGTVIDSLFIGADYTVRMVHVGPADNVFINGTWALLPGDRLAGPYYFDPVRIYLKNGELFRCHQNYAVLKRAGP